MPVRWKKNEVETKMRENIFDSLIESDSLFVDRQAFEHGFEPDSLPHREKEVRGLGENLVEALRGHIPSNMLLYGVPGSGKTIVTKTVLKQLKVKGNQMGQQSRPTQSTAGQWIQNTELSKA